MADESIIHEAQNELRRHFFSTFIDEGRSVAQGGRGVVVPGCPTCRKRLDTYSRFLDHLEQDVLPGIVARALANGSNARPPS